GFLLGRPLPLSLRVAMELVTTVTIIPVVTIIPMVTSPQPLLFYPLKKDKLAESQSLSNPSADRLQRTDERSKHRVCMCVCVCVCVCFLRRRCVCVASAS